MARGRDTHQARLTATHALGKTLTRRARSKCELCGDATALAVIEIPPLPEHPTESSAVLACERCRTNLDGKLDDADTLRFLETTIWEELIPVRLAAHTLARRLAADDVGWAKELLDSAWVDDELQALLDQLK